MILTYDKIINIPDNNLRTFKNYSLLSVFLDDFGHVHNGKVSLTDERNFSHTSLLFFGDY